MVRAVWAVVVAPGVVCQHCSALVVEARTHLQALLKAESQLRAQETEASLLDEAASNLSTAAAAADTAALQGAAAARDREAAAAQRQLAQLTKTQQQAAAQQAAQQQEADARSRCGRRWTQRAIASPMLTCVCHATHWPAEPLSRRRRRLSSGWAPALRASQRVQQRWLTQPLPSTPGSGSP
jgi:hypothetical protein